MCLQKILYLVIIVIIIYNLSREIYTPLLYINEEYLLEIIYFKIYQSPTKNFFWILFVIYIIIKIKNNINIQ